MSTQIEHDSKNLWLVTFIMPPQYVLAATESEAREVAAKIPVGDMDTSIENYFVPSPVNTGDSVIDDWGENCIPWGSTDDVVLAEIVGKEETK